MRRQFQAIGLTLEAEMSLDDLGGVQIDELYCEGKDAGFLMDSRFDREIIAAAAEEYIEEPECA